MVCVSRPVEAAARILWKNGHIVPWSRASKEDRVGLMAVMGVLLDLSDDEWQRLAAMRRDSSDGQEIE